jgi:hypothetical protein
MRVQPTADEDELEDLIKGREDRDEEELPDSGCEGVEEDWDVDLPVQDNAGALEAEYNMQYGFNDFSRVMYDNDMDDPYPSPRLPQQSLKSPPHAHSLSATPTFPPRAFLVPVPPAVRVLCWRHPTRSPGTWR